MKNKKKNSCIYICGYVLACAWHIRFLNYMILTGWWLYIFFVGSRRKQLYISRGPRSGMLYWIHYLLKRVWEAWIWNQKGEDTALLASTVQWIFFPPKECSKWTLLSALWTVKGNLSLHFKIVRLYMQPRKLIMLLPCCFFD